MNGVAKRYPDIYLLSRFPGLEAELRKCIPKESKLIIVPASAPFVSWGQESALTEEEKEFVKAAEVLVCDSTYLMSLLYENLPNLKWVQTTWAGVDLLMKKYDESKPLPPFTISRYSDRYFGELMGNYCIAQIVNIERGMYTYRDQQMESKWIRPYFPNFRVLSELTVGVLGAGTLGSRVGRLLKNCGCRVMVLVHSKRDSISDNYDEATTELNDILERCDYICNILPSTGKTKGLLNGDVLQNCKKIPVFINIGRADIIDESSIIKALKNGWISKAILDVTGKEPLPSDSQLYKTDGVYITPHIAAIPKISGIAEFMVQNYLRYVDKEPVMNILDFEKGY